MYQMEQKDGLEVAASRWEVFALSWLAHLGPFAQVHLAPKIPPGLLNTALMAYLSLEDDEYLLAVIDGSGGKLAGCCALTTRRLYWAAVDESDEIPPTVNGRLPIRFRQRLLRRHVLEYGALPPAILESHGPDGSSRLDFGGERVLTLKGVDANLALCLRQYLAKMRAVARGESAPVLDDVEPDLAARAARAWPAVAQVSSRARNLGVDLHLFRDALETATPHAFVTPFLILVCVVVYADMVFSRVDPMWPTGPQLILWGANEGARVILRHEYWRLLTSVFVHGGLIHVALNMWSLLAIGPLVERLYGNAAFAVIYVAAGIGGALSSVAANPVPPSVGASGAICGVLGALVAFLLVHRRAIPSLVLKPLRANALGYVVFIAIMGRVVPNIDQAAHLGGLATGFVVGLLLFRPWPVVKGKWVAVRRALASVLIAAALVGAAAVAGKCAMTLPPQWRFQDLKDQIASPLDSFNAISKAIPGSMVLRRDRSVPDARQTHVRAIQDLTQQGNSNLAILRRVKTPDPALGTMVSSLIQAQSSQIAMLAAAHRFLESGNTVDIDGEYGFLALRAATDLSVRTLQKQLLQYRTDNGLISRSATNEP
jgi:rhomboid protease GluP